MSLSSVRQSGRTPHLASKLPPKVMTALALAATGKTWADAAAEVNMTADALRKWRHHEDAQPFLETVVRENLSCAKNLALSKSHRMIEILCEIAENEKNRPYSRVNAADKVLEKAAKFDEIDFMRKELAKVRELLEEREEGKGEIIDISG